MASHRRCIADDVTVTREVGIMILRVLGHFNCTYMDFISYLLYLLLNGRFFLQRVIIACYAERCISYARLRLSVSPSVTVWYHVIRLRGLHFTGG